MKVKNLVITGVGGQGVLLVTRVLAEAALSRGTEATVSEVHGMAQRGGSVVSNVRFGPASSPLVSRGEADAIMALEPMEALRVLDRASSKTVIVASMATVAPLMVLLGKVEYPPMDILFRDMMAVTRRVYGVDAEGIAAQVGSPVVSNVVLLGALLGTRVLPIELEAVRESLSRQVPLRTLELNLKALEIGLDLTSAEVEIYL